VALIEIQQNCDITYRLYDYGRPRELHLDAAVAVARGETYPERLHRSVEARGYANLVEGPHFRLDRVDGALDTDVAARYQGPLLVIPLDGTALVGGEEIKAGECALAGSLDDVTFSGQNLITQPCA
jgi:mannose-6-phosphate isomerase